MARATVNHGANLGFEAQLWATAGKLRGVGFMSHRARRDLGEDDIGKVAGTCHRWRNKEPDEPYKDIPGICQSTGIEGVETHGFILTPGRHVGVAPPEEDDEAFSEKNERVVANLLEQQPEGAKLNAVIADNMDALALDVSGREVR